MSQKGSICEQGAIGEKFVTREKFERHTRGAGVGAQLPQTAPVWGV
jgi:hypothetical protein